jgi:D-lactate dehydrogenase (cytochrome)
MLSKSNADEIASLLSDASNMKGGHAERAVFPESAAEVAAVLAEAARTGTAVTVSGAGTGVTGGRIPFGGLVLATDRLARILRIEKEGDGGWAAAEAGVVLGTFQSAVAAEGQLYPPDPTEWSCYLGGTVATNASGARTFKYGTTRDYVRRLQIALPSGELLELRRGEIFAGAQGRLRIPCPGGRAIEAQLPTYRMPRTRKHAAGYFIAPEMDAIDLFIGSEGTLGVITEVEVRLLPQPANVLAGIVFFDREDHLLAFVRDARAASLQTRAGLARGLDARALEYFDAESLAFLREHNPRVPSDTAGAIFFEQEISDDTEDELMAAWLELLERHNARLDDSWFAANEHDRRALREFRHALPVRINEWIARHAQRKVSTDMAVPDDAFPAMMQCYKDTLRASGLQYVIFGHVGDNHVHVNILPRNDAEAARARKIYAAFVQRAVEMGGTVSAEHGIGKLKREYLRMLYGDEHLREMAALKRAFDPAGILGRGNIFAEEFLG